MSDTYWALEGSDGTLSARCLDEAIQDWLENQVFDESYEDLPKTLTICEWKLPELSRQDKHQVEETIYEYLDCNYMYEEFDPFQPSVKLKEKFSEFWDLLVKEYVVSVLHPTGNKVEVVLENWLNENNAWDLVDVKNPIVEYDGSK